MTPAEVLKRESAKARRSALEEAFALQLRGLGIAFEREHRFHPERLWRFDFVILPLERRLAVEIHGGTWVHGRHSRPLGQEADMRKHNEAVALGWRVLAVSTDHVKSGEAVRWVERMLQAEAA